MNAGVTSERIYEALKARLLSGSVPPGERLEPAQFADLLGSSVTPVRDALHRLAGENLVEMRLAEGFQLPLVTEPGLRDLLIWSADLLRLALRRWPRAGQTLPIEPLPDDHVEAARQLFSIIAARSGSVELVRHVDAANDRLTPARVAEAKIWPDLRGELAQLSTGIANGDAAAIAHHVTAYHRRRKTQVSAIVEAMYRSD